MNRKPWQLGWAIVGAMIAMSSPGWAATRNWTGASGTDWGTAGNWVGGVPGSGDDVYFDGNSTANRNTSIGSTSYTVRSINANSALPGDVSIDGTGAISFNVNGIAWFSGVTKNLTVNVPVSVAVSSGTQAWWVEPGTTVSISGSVTANQSLWLRGNSGNTGAGTFVFSGGGSVASGKNFIIGDTSYKAKLEIAGGTFDASASNTGLFGGSAANTLTVSGGTFKPSSANNVNLLAGCAINITGGTFDASGLTANDVIIGQTGSGSISVSAGQYTGSSSRILYIGNGGGGNGTLTVSGSGTVDVASGAASTIVVGRSSGTGTLNLNGGTMLTSRSIRGSDSGAGTGSVYFNGGTLKARDGNNASWLLSASTFNAYVSGGGAIFDTAGYAMGIPVALQHDSGGPATDGGLIKTGAGTLTLTGANAYNGGTTVTNGTLQVGDGSVNGTIGSYAYGIASNATLRLNYATAAAPIWGNISGAGTFALKTAASGDTGWNTTIQLPSTFTGTVRVESGRLWLANASPLGNATNVVVQSGGQLGMQVSSVTQPLTLAGTGYGDPSGYDGALRVNNNAVLSGNVSLSAGATIGTGATATFSGVISGSGSSVLTLGTSSQAGTVLLSNANTYSGGTTVNYGTLKLGNTLALGSTTGNLTLNTSSAYLDLNGYNPTVGALTTVTGSRILNGTGNSTITAASASLAGYLYYNSANTSTLRIDTSAGNGALTLNGMTSGASGVLWSFNNLEFNAGSGSLTVSGTDTFNWWSGGATITLAGQVTGSGNISQGGVSSGAATLTFSNPGSSTYSGVISSALFNVVKTGAGTQTFSGNHTYTGTTTVNQGTLTLSGSPTGNSAITINTNGTLALDYSVNNTGKIHDSAVLTLAGGAVRLSGGSHTEAVGSTTLAAGTASSVTRDSGTSVLQMNTITRNAGAKIDFAADNIASTDNLNSGGILGTWATVGGTELACNSSGGADGLIVAYTGYSDVTRRDSGVQVIADASSSNVRIIEGSGTPGNITLAAATTTVNTVIQSAVGGSSAATIDPAANTLRLGAAGGFLVPSGAGDLTVGTAANSGTLTAGGADNTAGDLAVNNLGAGTVTIQSVIANNGSGAVNFARVGAGPVVLAGDNTYTGTTAINDGLLQIGNGGAAGALGSGATTITSPGSLKFNRTGALVVSSAIGGTGGLTQLGSGTVTLSGANNYSGGTLISAGTLQVGNGGASGGLGSGGITNNSNLAYSFNSSTALALPTSATYSGSGNLSATSGYINFSGNLAVGGVFVFNATTANTSGGSTANTILTAASASLSGYFAFNANSTTSALTIDTTTANGAITFNNIQNGTPGNNYGVNSVTFNAGSGTITAGGTSTFNWWNNNSTVSLIGLVTGFGNIVGAQQGGSAATLTINNPSASTYSGVISGPFKLVKDGVGTQTLTGANSYSGGTTVTNGMLQLGNGSVNGTFGSGTYGIASNATLRLNYATASAPTWANISGAGTLSLKTAASGDAGWSTTIQLPSTFTGMVRVESGRLWLGNASPVGNATNITVQSGGQLGVGIAAVSQPLTIAGTGYGGGVNDGVLRVQSAVLSGNIALAASASISVDSGNTTTFSGVISGGSGSVLTVGGGSAEAGTYVLSNANTYTGGASLVYGKLVLNNNSALGSGALTIGGGTTIDSTVAGITLAGNAQNWNGDFTFTGTQSLNLGAGAVTLGGNRQVTASANMLTVGGVVSGAFNLTKAGAGTLTLTNANTYSGTTTVSAGTLNLGGSHSAANDFVISAATVNLSGSETVTGTSKGIYLSGNSTLNVQAGGALAYSPADGANFFCLSQNAAGTSTVRIYSGGAVTVSNGGFAVGNNLGTAIGVLTMDTGSAMTLDATSPGAGGFVVGRSGSVGTVNLDGGTLTTGRDITSGGTSTFNFNGGTLKPGKTSASFLTGLTRANVRNGGAVIDTAGYNITIGQALLHSNVGGDSATDGGLTKTGSGTLTLSNTGNNYTGGTTINLGTLSVAGSVLPGAIAIGAAGFLDDSRSAAQIANVITGAGTWNLSGIDRQWYSGTQNFSGFTGTLNLPSGARFWNGQGSSQYPGAGATINIASGGELALASAGTNPSAANIAGTGHNSDGYGALRFESGAVQAGSITLTGNALIRFGSGYGTLGQTAISGGTISVGSYTLTLFPVGGQAPAVNGNLTGSGTVTRQAGGGYLYLGGDNSGFSGTYNNDNRTYFTSASAGSASATWNANGAILRASVAGTPTISLGALTGSGTVDNDIAGSTVTYSVGAKNADCTFSGTLVNGSGTTALAKTGTGTLTLNNAGNTYSGATTVNDGKLEVTAGAKLGASTNVTVNGGFLSLLGSSAIDAVANTAVLRIYTGGKVQLPSAGANETVRELYINGARMYKGTWGSSSSPAAYTNDLYFGGSGIVTVSEGAPHPATVVEFN